MSGTVTFRGKQFNEIERIVARKYARRKKFLKQFVDSKAVFDSPGEDQFEEKIMAVIEILKISTDIPEAELEGGTYEEVYEAFRCLSIFEKKAEAPTSQVSEPEKVEESTTKQTS